MMDRSGMNMNEQVVSIDTKSPGETIPNLLIVWWGIASINSFATGDHLQVTQVDHHVT